MKRVPRRLLMWGGALAIATAGFAYMASNSVGASNAGVGDGAISGYQVQNVHYYTVSNALVPGGFYIQGVIFTLNPNTANEVTAWFQDGSAYTGGYYNCTQLTADDPAIDTMFGISNTKYYWSCGSSPYGGGISTSTGPNAGGYSPLNSAYSLHVAASQ